MARSSMTTYTSPIKERIENALACLEEVQMAVASATFQVKEALKLLDAEPRG